jgi:hypothetical protein
MTRVSGPEMIARMNPVLHAGSWVFVTCPEDRTDLPARALASIREGEGLSLLLAAEEAPWVDGPRMAWIELQVNSALDGVGLTAAVASALSGDGIACNVVAGHHHDHVFVPEAAAARALALLEALAASARREDDATPMTKGKRA